MFCLSYSTLNILQEACSILLIGENLAEVDIRQEIKLSEHGAKITGVYQQLVDSLRRTDLILTTLLQNKFLKHSEYAVIKTHASVYEVVQHLLDVLIIKPPEAYACFLEALKATQQPHLFLLLEDNCEICVLNYDIVL